MNNNEFRKKFRVAICTENPIDNLIPTNIKSEIILQIKNESINKYGVDLMSECSKRKVCFKKSCLGRPLAWEAPTAQVYLQQLEHTHTIINGELFIEANCQVCPIQKNCASLCEQVVDFVKREENSDLPLYFKREMDKLPSVTLEEETTPSLDADLKIPWDILSEKKESIIRKYLYENKDLTSIAKELGILNRARVKYFLYAALTKLSKYGRMRQFLIDRGTALSIKQENILFDIFMVNENISIVAKENGVTRQAISKIINEVIEKYNIKWKVFVKKEGNRVIYNNQLILK